MMALSPNALNNANSLAPIVEANLNSQRHEYTELIQIDKEQFDQLLHEVHGLHGANHLLNQRLLAIE